MCTSEPAGSTGVMTVELSRRVMPTAAGSSSLQYTSRGERTQVREGSTCTVVSKVSSVPSLLVLTRSEAAARSV
ncbi:MAG: hypothetical protein R3A52_19115 [Polyangiales bacterium]